MEHQTIIRELPTLPPHLLSYVEPEQQRSRSTSSNRNASKTRTPSLTRRGSDDPNGKKRERGRQTERDGAGPPSSHSRGRTISPMAARRTASKAREKEQREKEQAKAVKLEEMALEVDVKPKRVKVGARASIGERDAYDNPASCADVQHSLRDLSKAKGPLLRRVPDLSVLRRSLHGLRLRRTSARARWSTRQPERRNSGVSLSFFRQDDARSDFHVSTTSFAFPANFLPVTYVPTLPPAEAILGSLDDFFSHY